MVLREVVASSKPIGEGAAPVLIGAVRRDCQCRRLAFGGMTADESGASISVGRVRDRQAAVLRARQVLDATLYARDRELAAARTAGASTAILGRATEMSDSAVNRAVIRGRTATTVDPTSPSMWIALDSPSTRIREDAFRVQVLGDRRWLVEVCVPAVADVVTCAGALDREAQARVQKKSSTGLFPRSLENHLSLGPHFSGPVMVITMTFSEDARKLDDVGVHREVVPEGAIAAIDVNDGDWLLDTCADQNPAYHLLARSHGWVVMRRRDGAARVAAHTIVSTIATQANLAATQWAVRRGLTLLRDSAGSYGPAEAVSGRHAQVTNPLRRYTSVINQRIILSEIDVRPAPYTDTAIRNLSRTLNNRLVPLTAGHRKVVHQSPADSLGSSALQAGPEDDWREELRVNILLGPPSLDIAQRFRDKCSNGTVTWQEFKILLCASDDWAALRNELVLWMRTERPDILQELLRSLAKDADATVTFETAQPIEPIRTWAFGCRVLLNGYAVRWAVLDEETWMQRPQVQTRKGVRHEAAWSAIEVLLGWQDYEDISVDPDFSEVADRGGGRPPTRTRVLHDRAFDIGLPAPVFETTETSPTTDSPQFRCTASGFGYSVSCERYRRDAAHEAAAEALLERLRAEARAPAASLEAI